MMFWCIHPGLCVYTNGVLVYTRILLVYTHIEYVYTHIAICVYTNLCIHEKEGCCVYHCCLVRVRMRVRFQLACVALPDPLVRSWSIQFHFLVKSNVRQRSERRCFMVSTEFVDPRTRGSSASASFAPFLGVRRLRRPPLVGFSPSTNCRASTSGLSHICWKSTTSFGVRLPTTLTLRDHCELSTASRPPFFTFV